MRTAALLVGILSLGVASLAGAQTIYKWVDNEGIINFGAHPPLGVNAERTTARLHGTNRQTLQSSSNKSPELKAAVNTRKQHEKEQAAEDKTLAKQEQQLRIETCKKAKVRLVKYNESRRLYRQLENGERDYLDDDELDQERASAQQLVNKWCD